MLSCSKSNRFQVVIWSAVALFLFGVGFTSGSLLSSGMVRKGFWPAHEFSQVIHADFAHAVWLASGRQHVLGGLFVLSPNQGGTALVVVQTGDRSGAVLAARVRDSAWRDCIQGRARLGVSDLLFQVTDIDGDVRLSVMRSVRDMCQQLVGCIEDVHLDADEISVYIRGWEGHDGLAVRHVFDNDDVESVLGRWLAMSGRLLDEPIAERRRRMIVECSGT